MNRGPSFDLGLEDKVVLITGGSRGIGRAIAQAFVDAGARVRITARNGDALLDTAKHLGPTCSWAVADVTDGQAAGTAVDRTVDELGALDVLINNAGMGVPLGPLVDLQASKAARAALVNQWAPVMWSTLAWQAWQGEHGGAIVNLASIGGLVPWRHGAYYGATKAALIHLTRHLALEFRPGVRVNAVAPGAVETDLSRAVIAESDGVRPQYRIGRPEEVADLVLFLASARASLVSGATLVAADPALLVISH